MTMSATLALSLLALMSFITPPVQGKKIFCYYSSFAQRRQGVGNFLPEDINPHLCTHIIYAFVDITPDGRDLMPFNRNDQGPKGLYARTLALKEKNPALKVLLAVGGWQIGSKPFIPMVSSPETRREWIENVVSYVRKHGFDGFDVDWEFPATRGSPPEDKYRFTQLMKGLYEAFAREAQETGNEKLLLTLATASGTYYISQSYETSKIINYIDYMFLMTYNYHGQWEKQTGHHSGLYRHSNDPKTGEKSQLYQQWSIDFWLNEGMPKERLIVGIPTYGMSFTLANPANHGVRAPVVGGGRMGDYTKETGILAFYEICLNIRNKGWQSEWIDDQAVPYVYGGDQWAGYETKKSIALKAENILSRDLGGAFVWSVEMDDFSGTCGEGEYPLLSTISRIIGNSPDHGRSAHRPRWHPAPAAEEKSELEESDSQDFIQNPQFKKVKGLHRRNKVQNAPASKQKWETEAPPPEPTAAAVEESTSGDRLLVTWWKGSSTRKVNKWRPWKKSSSARPQRKITKRPKKFWRRKGTKKAIVKSTPEYKIVNKPPTKSWYDSAEVPHPSDHQVSHWHPRSSTERRSTVETPWNNQHEEAENSVNAAASSNNNICARNGVGTFPSPGSCDHFVVCMPGDWRDYAPHVMACPPGTRFDADLKICNYADHVDCHR